MNELKLMNATETKDFEINTVNGAKVVKANYTENNVFNAFKYLDNVTNKADYARAILIKLLIESCGDDSKAIAALKKKLVEEYGFNSTSVIDKLYRVADTFLTVTDDVLTGSWERDKDGHTTTALSVNTKSITAIKDKFGFEFSMSALQEMLWLKDKDGNVDTDKITELIKDGKLKASMPASNKETGIRAVVNANKPNTPTTPNGNSNGNSNSNNGNGNGNSDDKKSIEYKDSSDKSKAVAIQTIANSIKATEFTENEIAKSFLEYLTEFIANKNIK